MKNQISMTEKVTTDLRDEITNGAYRSDILLTEYAVSQKYNVSKTPAREALGQLCAEGLLEKIPRKGYLIRRFSMADMRNLLQFRYILETCGIELAIRLATDGDIAELRALCESQNRLSKEECSNQYVALNAQFHVALISLGKNPYLTAALANTMDQLKLALSIDQAVNPLVVKLEDHLDIIKALEERDVKKAKSLVGRFVDNVHDRIPANQTKWEKMWL